MSTDSRHNKSTSSLRREFIERATRLGGFLSVPPKIPFRSAERQKLTSEINAIAAELSRRNDPDELTPLFNHEDPDVRMWAGVKFSSIDSEQALAAFSGALEGVPTKEVLDLTRRARQVPSPRPTLQEMSVEQLVARFEDACLRYYGVRYLAGKDGGPCYSAISRVSGEIGQVVREIEKRGATDRLLPLLNHKNVVVRRHAAESCLPIAEAHATTILNAIAAEHPRSLDAVEAIDALERWRGEGIHRSLLRH